MKVLINNKEQTLKNNQTLYHLLSEMNLNEARGTAIAVNDTVIPKSEWQKFLLNENDKLTVIRATQGG